MSVPVRGHSLERLIAEDDVAHHANSGDGHPQRAGRSEEIGEAVAVGVPSR